MSAESWVKREAEKRKEQERLLKEKSEARASRVKKVADKAPALWEKFAGVVENHVAEFNSLFRDDKQKTAYEMRESDWSSDVCSSDLGRALQQQGARGRLLHLEGLQFVVAEEAVELGDVVLDHRRELLPQRRRLVGDLLHAALPGRDRKSVV